MLNPSSVKDATLHLSTRDATHQDGNKWTIALQPNVLHGKNIARLIPTHAMVPNIFNNARSPYNGFTIQDITTPGVVINEQIPIGFYSGAELATAVNLVLVALGMGDLTLVYVAINAVQNRFQWVNVSATVTFELNVTGQMDRLIGIAPSTNSTTGIITILPATTVVSGTPNLAGERIVHIKSEKLGHSMGIHSAENSTQDMCLSVPLHETKYGGVAHWAPSDGLASALDMAFDITLSNGLDISLWDNNMEPLSLPANHEIELQFKIIHSSSIQ